MRYSILLHINTPSLLLDADLTRFLPISDASFPLPAVISLSRNPGAPSSRHTTFKIVRSILQSFSVAWRKDDHREIASSGHIFIDGKDVASGVMRPRRTRHVERSAAKVSSSRARAFYFTTLELTGTVVVSANCFDIFRVPKCKYSRLFLAMNVKSCRVDDELIAPLYDQRLKDAGSIRLEVTFVRLGAAVPIVPAEVESITIAHEKAKKAGAMVTT